MIKYLKYVVSRRDCILYGGVFICRGYGERLIWLNKERDKRNMDILGLFIWIWRNVL